MSNSIAPGSSADVNVKITALTTNLNVPAQYKTIILKKNLVNGVNTLTQKMMSATNTKYIIKYNYVLGEDITIPDNCILEFDGGNLSNGTVNLNSVKIQSGVEYIFNNITFEEYCYTNYIYPEWFDSKENITNDASNAFAQAVAFSEHIQNIDYNIHKEKGNATANVVLQQSIYNLKNTIIIDKGLNLFGNNAILNCDHNEDFIIKFNAGWSPFKLKTFVVKDIIINGNYKNVIGLCAYCSGGYFENICVNNCFNRSIDVAKGYENMFKHINIETKGVVAPHAYPEDFTNFIGFHLRTSDCMIDDIIVKGVPQPIYVSSGNNHLSNIHVWGTQKDVLPRYAVYIYSITGCKIINVTADTINRADNTKEVQETVNGCINGGAALIFYNATQNFVENVYVMANTNVFNGTGLTKYQDYIAYFNEWGRGNTISHSFIHNSSNPGVDAFVGYYYQNILFDIKTDKVFNSFSQYGIFLNVEASKLSQIKNNVQGDAIDNFAIYICNNNIIIRKGKELSGFEKVYLQQGSESEIPNPNNPITYGEQHYYAWDTKSLYIKHNNNKYTVIEGIICEYTNGALTPIIHKGSLDTKPNGDYLYNGFYYFDEDNKRPIFYNGNNSWIDANGVNAKVKRSGTFAKKPDASDIYIGFKYFCTDKQTTEGATDGIEIIHKGDNVWVDALGRVVS